MKVLWAAIAAGVALGANSPATHAATLTVCNYSDTDVSQLAIDPLPKWVAKDKRPIARKSCVTIAELPEAQYKLDLTAGADCRTPVRVVGNANYIFDQTAKDQCDHDAMRNADN